jgi:Tol biopolymer transport system component
MINGEVAAYETKTDQTLSNCVYPYWHPSGRYIAYSVNTTRQMFPMSTDKRIEVYDEASDIVVFDNNTKRLISSKLLTTNKFETFPAFSSDGKYLYFCVSDQKKMPDEYQEVRYALCRIAFHPEPGTFGSVMDTLINAPAMGKSLTFPRPSPDGKNLMFT